MKNDNCKNLGIESLGLHEILDLLSEVCMCKEAKVNTRKLNIDVSFERTSELLKETHAAFDALSNFGDIPIGNIKNIKSHLKRAKHQASLSPKELLDIKGVLFSVENILNWYKNLDNFSDVLSDKISSLSPNKQLFVKIDSSIISEEEIADSASSELFSLRNKERALSSKIREILEDIIRSSRYQKFLQESIITVRNSRFVIPIKAEFRSEMEGFLHDTSSSGATVFIEPKQVLDANNQIASLRLQERREIERILSKISEEVANFSDFLLLDYELLVKLDMIFSRARLAKKMRAVPPKLNDSGVTALKKARHPLIDQEKVVPIDVSFGGNIDCLMITGPNTGGKTVSIKIVGIFVIMAKLGLMIPAEDGSEICIFDKIFVDIGDEQSIEQSLSTFSGHISKLVQIIKFADHTSLVLLDELGAGTDPEQGAALALSIVEYLRGKKAKIMVTTHYPALKEYAFSSKGVQNACCEFDVKTLMPTYKLITGIPGRSNAFEISKRLGIKEEIIEKARKFMSLETQKLDFIIESLEIKREEIETKNKELEKLLHQAKIMKNEILTEKKNIKNQSDTFLENSKLKSREIILKARKEATEFLLELKKIKSKGSLAVLDKTKLRKNIKILDESLLEENKIESRHKTPENLKIGDNVLIVDIKKQATVLELDKNDTVTVDTGSVKLKVNISQLKLLDKSDIFKNKKGNVSTKHVRRKRITAVSELDLRGYYSLEAIEELDRFIDSALLSGVNEIRIIHGKGTMVLMREVANHLSYHAHIKSFRPGKYGEGGIGVTVAQLI
ncbi:MAG: endonuclease MutS2 [Oscillospiraceae bacterium]|jgi:DNA mismatch repair protein MutS2|nr:endonuclease MutS2 [Oscillospiraceae bacterium]